MENKEVGNLRSRVIKHFSAHWELNDEAHRIGHFSEVERCALYIREKLELNVDPKLIMLAAYFHDLFSWTRINHHELAYQFVLTSDHEVFADLKDHERHMLAIACKHHRASYKGKFIYTLDQLINAADRMMPEKGLEEMIRRSLKVQTAKGLHGEENCIKTMEHLKEKFGTGGYARYPEMYRVAFGDALEAQQKEVDELTLETVMGIYSNRRETGKLLSSDALLQNLSADQYRVGEVYPNK